MRKYFSIIKQINGYFWDGAYCTNRYMINNYIKSMLLILHHIINKKKRYMSKYKDNMFSLQVHIIQWLQYCLYNGRIVVNLYCWPLVTFYTRLLRKSASSLYHTSQFHYCREIALRRSPFYSSDLFGSSSDQDISMGLWNCSCIK